MKNVHILVCTIIDMKSPKGTIMDRVDKQQKPMLAFKLVYYQHQSVTIVQHVYRTALIAPTITEMHTIANSVQRLLTNWIMKVLRKWVKQ